MPSLCAGGDRGHLALALNHASFNFSKDPTFPGGRCSGQVMTRSYKSGSSAS